MARLTYTIVLHPDPDSGGYGVEVPALPGVFTQGGTREEALQRAHEAISAHIAGLRADGEPVPEETEQPELARVDVAA